MKQKFTWMVWVCAVCLWTFAACTDHEPECNICDEQPDGPGVWLSFDFNDEQQTRSTLQSSEVNYKDVKEVYLYIFEGNTADAKCILVEKVGWKGNITQKHWISADLKEGVEHTFLAVGCDRKQEINSTYGFPDIIEKGSKLGDCMAKVQQGMTQNDIAHEQFFVGTLSKTVTNAVEDVALTLRRKVAGILVYLRNIPVKVDYKNEKRRVNTLEVRLHKPQHTDLKLWKIENTPVYGEGELQNSEVLFTLDLSEKTTSGFIPDKEERYFTKVGNDSILSDSYLAGAYLLPIAKTPGKATLSVNLRGDYTDGSGNTKENIVLKSYEVRYTAPKGTSSDTVFDIKENTLYAIGKKLSNSTTVNDEPADLSGNLLKLEVVPWKNIPLENVFPTVTGPARIEADYNDKKYVMDANQDTLVITIKSAVDKDPNVKKPWTLSVNYGEGLTGANEKFGNQEFNELPKDWIHFIARGEQGKFVEYTNTLKGNEEQEVIVIVNDYAVERELGNKIHYTNEDLQRFKNDIRRAVIELHTDGVNEPYTLQVQQYNTLTIKTNDDYQNPRGITRLDYGCTFNKQTGEVMGQDDNCKIVWGYFSTGNFYVSGDNPMNYTDGEITSDKCYNRLIEGHGSAKRAYMGSAIQKLTKRFIHLETNADGKVVDTNPENKEDHTKEKNWYMPAYYEMWGVTKTARYDLVDYNMLEELMNMHKEDVYWCSSGDDFLITEAYIIRIGHFEKSEHKDKTNAFYARPMVHFKPHE